MTPRRLLGLALLVLPVVAVVSLLQEPSPSSAPAMPATTLRDVYAVDGDTITARAEDGAEIRIRLLGIDAPEHGECGFQEATDGLTTLLQAGGSVEFTHDPATDQHDRYGRFLGYVAVDGNDAGLSLIDDGLVAAWWPRSAATPARADTYRSAHDRAEAAEIGSWAACSTLGRSR